jgi:hypothetical protein
MTDAEKRAILSHFEMAPDDSIVPAETAEVVTGGLYKKQQWRRKPPIPKRHVSERRFGFRVGDIRSLIRGEIQPAT